MGAVVNMRPDLFCAAILGVPFVDCLTTMLDETIPLTGGGAAWRHARGRAHSSWVAVAPHCRHHACDGRWVAASL